MFDCIYGSFSNMKMVPMVVWILLLIEQSSLGLRLCNALAPFHYSDTWNLRGQLIGELA